MLQIGYKPAFLRVLKKLPQDLQREARERIVFFSENPRHPSLRVHKLKGMLKGKWSFSVNYRYRIVFEFESRNAVALLAIGDHRVYD